MKRIAILIPLILLCMAAVPSSQPAGGNVTPPPQRNVPGTRIETVDGEIFVPDYFSPGEKTDVVVWFLGAPWVVEQEFYDAHKNAVLFVATTQTMQNSFPGWKKFDNLIGNIQIDLKKKNIADKPIGKSASAHSATVTPQSGNC